MTLDNQFHAPPPVSFDALLPAEMAAKAETVGQAKARLDWQKTFVLAVLAGSFIGLGALFATTVTTGAGALPFGIVKLLGGSVFCLGLILVIVAGGELFTGNALIVMAWSNGRITTLQVLRNWVIVYLGNLFGSVATAVLIFMAGHHTFGGGQVGLNALVIANAKCNLGFVQAVALGIGCNALVCLAVWLCFSARTTTDKILAILFPITAFVATGMEHCVANMYFIPMALLIKLFAPASFWAATGKTAADFSSLTTGNFFWANLLPVTIGNIIGGAVMVGVVYWFVYLKKSRAAGA